VPLGEVSARVRQNLQDDLLEVPEIEDAIERAVALFSADCPRVLSYEWTGDGETYEFALPADFEQGVSYIKVVEYPAGERRPQILRPDQYLIYDSKLRLVNATPGSTEKVKIHYTAKHSVTESTTTLSDAEELALSDLATSLVARMLASKYMRMFDPGIISEGIDYGRKAEMYLKLAEQFYSLYKKQLPGIAEGHLRYLESSHWRTLRNLVA